MQDRPTRSKTGKPQTPQHRPPNSYTNAIAKEGDTLLSMLRGPQRTQSVAAGYAVAPDANPALHRGLPPPLLQELRLRGVPEASAAASSSAQEAKEAANASDASKPTEKAPEQEGVNTESDEGKEEKEAKDTEEQAVSRAVEVDQDQEGDLVAE
ncbi:unnamed protein product [Symbiodinium natans]|uniref:Uncharacterized protein n=1 Tax=Symbiodinium natans TaxID=878477 RepID=A0A812R8H4_9DINO|nr:unnamed protein product [Symbiodinium natans]